MGSMEPLLKGCLREYYAKTFYLHYAYTGATHFSFNNGNNARVSTPLHPPLVASNADSGGSWTPKAAPWVPWNPCQRRRRHFKSGQATAKTVVYVHGGGRYA